MALLALPNNKDMRLTTRHSKFAKLFGVNIVVSKVKHSVCILNQIVRNSYWFVSNRIAFANITSKMQSKP